MILGAYLRGDIVVQLDFDLPGGLAANLDLEVHVTAGSQNSGGRLRRMASREVTGHLVS